MSNTKSNKEVGNFILAGKNCISLSVQLKCFFLLSCSFCLILLILVFAAVEAKLHVSRPLKLFCSDHIWVIHSGTFDMFTAEKMKSSIKDFFSKCDKIPRLLRIWSRLLKKSLMEKFIFSAVVQWIGYCEIIVFRNKTYSMIISQKHAAFDLLFFQGFVT